MRKISAMYEWSGGTDYRHTCYECNNCRQFQKGGRKVYKCLAYGNTDSVASDWKASYIACRHFNKPCPPLPIIKTVRREQAPDVMEGQISLFEFLEEIS